LYIINIFKAILNHVRGKTWANIRGKTLAIVLIIPFNDLANTVVERHN